jgi:hypothetical protein
MELVADCYSIPSCLILFHCSACGADNRGYGQDPKTLKPKRQLLAVVCVLYAYAQGTSSLQHARSHSQLEELPDFYSVVLLAVRGPSLSVELKRRCGGELALTLVMMSGFVPIEVVRLNGQPQTQPLDLTKPSERKERIAGDDPNACLLRCKRKSHPELTSV